MPLAQRADFLKLWSGQTVSMFGSGITGSALPLTAVLVLGASSLQMGFLMAAGSAPFALIGLVAGVWVDRLRRRPLMLAADLGRAALLLSIPLAFLLGRLHMGQLFLVAALVGVLTVCFDVAYQAFLPELVPPHRLLNANSKLAGSAALAEIMTPGLAGILVQVMSAPLTLLLDALSFLLSAASIGWIGYRERAVPLPAERNFGREIGEGLHFVLGEPMLRALVGYTATRSFFGNWIGALYALYLLRDLGLGPILLGVTIGVGGASNLLGTVIVGPLTRQFGLGRTVLLSLILAGLASFTIPLAHGPVLLAFAMIAFGQAFDAVHPIFDVNILSLRQSITPPHLLGRVSASVQVLAGASTPLGAVIGGLLGWYIGVRPTLILAAAGGLLSILWLVFSPLRTLREVPVRRGEGAGDGA